MRKIIAVLLCFISVLMGTVCAFGFENEFKAPDIVNIDQNYINPLYSDVVSAEDFSEEYPYDLKNEGYLPMAEGQYMTTVEEAAEYLKEQLIRRNGEIAVYYAGTIDPQEIANLIFDKAIEHTGNPIEGDYILGQFGGWQAKIQGYSDGTKYYLTISYYNILYYTDAAQEKIVDNKIDEVLEKLDLEGKSDYEKIKAIYDYICENVTYDYTNLNDESYMLKYTAYAALIDKTAVCQGYSMLLYRFALEENIDTRFITGVQTSSNGAHGWNIAKLGGKYYNLDSTWDAGRSVYSFFLKNNEEFEDHTRNTEYNTSDFNSAYPMSEKSFDPSTDDLNIASGYCGAEANGENLKWVLDKNGTLTISGKGKMADYYVNPLEDGTWGTVAPWGNYWEQIKSIVIEEGVTSIGEAAFYRFWNVTGELKLPSTLKNIGADAFNAVPYEGTLVIPEGVESIGAWAFTRTFFDFVKFPSTLKEIAVNAFYVNRFQKITVASGNKYFCSVDGVLFNADKTKLLLYPNVLPEKYTVPEGVTEIGQYAFSACSAAGIVLPKTLTYIDGRAFNDYSGTITVNSKLEAIEDFAFFPMDNEILHIYFMAGEPGSIKSDSFRQTNGTIKLYYLSGTESKWTFDADGLWNGFVLNEYAPEGDEYDNFVIANGTLGDNITWELTYGGVFTISGNGEMITAYSEEAEMPWEAVKERIKTLVIEEGVTSIADYAFAGCKNLTGTLKLPDSIEKIGCCAFSETAFTGELVLPEKLTEISAGAFKNCSGFTGSINLPDAVSSIGAEAFYGCSGLGGRLKLSENVKSIGNGAFYGCGINSYYFNGDAPAVASVYEEQPSFDENDKIYYFAENSGWELDEKGLWNGYKITAYEKGKVIYGDVNGDGKINVLDANITRRYAAKLIDFADEQFDAADVDGSGNINVLDANYIRRYATKMINVFPVEG